MPKFTIQEVIDAAEKNGWEWRGANAPFRIDEDGHQTSFCVLEQTVKNLGGKGNWSILAAALDKIGVNSSIIWSYNDVKAKSYKDAVKYMKKQLAPFIDKTITVNKKYF